MPADFGEKHLVMRQSTIVADEETDRMDIRFGFMKNNLLLFGFARDLAQ